MFGNIKKFLRNFNLKENNRPLIFLICLLIATLLWLVKALEKQYDTTVSMSVQYTNLPENRVLINPPPSRLDVKLRAYGFTLLRHKFGLTITPINFDVRLFSINKLTKKDPTDFYLLTDQYISQFSAQVSSELTIVDISPDTLFFHYDKLSEKTVNIFAKLDISFQDNYYCADSIVLSPSQIIVRGPSTIVDTITKVYTKPQNFKNLTNSIQQNISLEKIEQLEFSSYKTLLVIPVSKQSVEKKKYD